MSRVFKGQTGFETWVLHFRALGASFLRFKCFIFKSWVLACLVAKLYHSRLVPSRYLSVFWDERRLGIRLRHALGVMGREEGKIASLNSDWVRVWYHSNSHSKETLPTQT